MPVVTRFAPSPTGLLHVGNIRTAIHNWLLARKLGGQFLLRIDDTDVERSREDYVEAIRADLAWLGLEPDREVRQSQRAPLYDESFEVLRAAGRIYPCYETAQELDLKRKVRLGRGLPPVYDRAALALSERDRAELEASGNAPHWRFLLDHDEPIAWDDAIRGPQHFQPALLSDPVIRRADGSWLYMLPSVIDDLDMSITLVLRGEDHVSNTAAQIQMFTALLRLAGEDSTRLPVFAHEALLVGPDGKLSKRLGSLSVGELRAQGFEAATLVALLARLGTSQPVEPIVDRATLVEGFDLAHFGRAPARFDEVELERLNAGVLHALDFAAVRDRLPPGMGEDGWHAIRPNLVRLADANAWWAIVRGPVEVPDLSAEDREYLALAADVLAWGDDPWHALTVALKARTGRQGRALFLPLRLALTGRDKGPDMSELLPLIGEAEARRRFQKATATT